MSFSVITQFAALVFLQKWKFVLQTEAHSTPSQELLEHSGRGALIYWQGKETKGWRK